MSYRYGYNRYNDPDYYWKADEKAIKRDFMNYANKERKIEDTGYEKMGKTLGIDIYTDIFITYFAYKCEAKQLDFITESEYIKGLTSLKCNTLTDVKNKIINIRGELLDIHSDDFRNFYYFLFDLNMTAQKEKKKGKTSIFRYC